MRGWRKWSVAMTGIIAVAVLAGFERLDASAATSIGGMVAAFVAANLGVHRAKGD